MSYNVNQFRSLIARVLGTRPELYSESAVQLLLGTAAAESALGTYLRQLGGGPALGAFQMEGPTFDDLRILYGDRYPEITTVPFEELEWDLWSAIFMARLKYRSIPKPLPAPDDIRGMAEYWWRYYQTPGGAHKPSHFISRWQTMVV